MNKTGSNCSCGANTHDPHECYYAWWAKFKRPLPGFVNEGGKWVKNPSCWNGPNATASLGKIWLAVQAGGKCKDSPYHPNSNRAAPDFTFLANQSTTQDV
eukprot:2239273-Rhodomonas_salina.3